MKAHRLTLALVLLATQTAIPVYAGSYIGAGTTNPDRITHPTGYFGAGGPLTVTVCIDPDSAAAPNVSDINQLVDPVLNVIETWNRLQTQTSNVILGEANDIPSGTLDWETTIVHEVGHCIGLAHPNAASESGLPGADSNYTRAASGVNGSLDVNAGADGIKGSSDDQRNDDVNLHWFEIGVNNPFTLPGTVDSTTYTRDLADLPPLHSFAANADLSVGAALGFPSSEAVMQQGARGDEDQTQLSFDDVATIRMGMSGSDETQGTADDYTLNLVYAGISDSCNVRILITGTSFASCSPSTTNIGGNHWSITSALIRTSSTTNWYYRQTPIFADGFESGDTTVWDAEVP